MILKAHSVIHVHDFKCTFSNSVYNQTFKQVYRMNRSTCGNTFDHNYDVTISEINKYMYMSQILIMRKP